ncbi:MAG: hypothetical protein V2A54_08135 [Bacteroidota bacterium]
MAQTDPKGMWKPYYDYSVIIDSKESLYENDFKIDINPINNRNIIILYNFSYERDSDLKKDENGLTRVMIDSVVFPVTLSQLDTIYKLTRDLFSIQKTPDKFEANQFRIPPIIYDGPVPSVLLIIGEYGQSYKVEFNHDDDENYKKLLDYVLTVRNSKK